MTTGVPEGAPDEASVVVVVGRSDRDAAPVLEAVMAAVPGGCEVIAVVERGGGGRDFTGGKPAPPGVRVVALDRPLPFGAAANRGAAAAVGRSVCFLAAGAQPAPGWLPPLLAAVARDGVACAVPCVVAAGGGVLEAGCALDREGAVVALCAGGAPTSLEHAFPRRVDGGSRACVCVRRSSFLAAGGFDPGLDGLLPAGMDLSATLRASGLATVYEPASSVMVDDTAADTAGPAVAAASAAGRILRARWSASVPAGRPLAEGPERRHDRPAAVRDADCSERILVVARGVPAAHRSYGERRLAQLLGDLAALVPEGRLTLLAADGHGARRHAPPMLRRGVEVVVGPEDWDEWLERRRLLFTHVVVTDFPTLRRMDHALRRTQPQAHRILCPPSVNLPDETSREATGGEHDDAPGIRLLVRHLREQMERAAATFDAAWCATEGDRTWLAATAPDLPCVVIPTAADPAGGGPFAERSGYVVLAAPGADIVAGHDDAALHAVRALLPRLLEMDRTAFLRVVVDDPAPGLQLLAGPNVELVPAGDDPARWLRRSRVCLAWYPRGSGTRHAIALALDARTPVVTSPEALRDAGMAGITGLPALSGAVDAASAALLAQQLHAGFRRWEDATGQLAMAAEGPRSPSTARLRLLRACADAGIAPRPGVALEEPLTTGTVDEEPARPTNVAIVGSAWKEAPPMPDGPVPELPMHGPGPDDVAVNDRYQRWQARYGPTRRRLGVLERRLAHLARRPTFSIVMPVFNTDPTWLHEAISSVRAQVYGEWELCIGDDGSVAPGTLEVLEAHAREEPRVRIARLPGNQGISAASNAALALATGDFVGFLDHDDELKPHALGEIAVALDHRPDLDLLYTDEDKRDPDGRLVDPFFKPDWSPDHLMSRNYVCHFLVVRRSLLEKLGGLRSEFDGSQDYDLVLRATEATGRIAHVHEPLYTWRKVEGSTSSVADAKPWALDSARRALQDALDRRGLRGEVVDGMHPTTYRVRYAVRGRPTVSILIPTRDRVDLLRNCIDSIQTLSTYTDYELVVVDNDSTDADTLAYLATLPGRVVRYPHRFNYARMMNLAAQEAKGDLLLFLNNDTQVRSPGWIEALVEHGQRPEVGVVGPRLLYPNGHAQHEGIIVGHKGGHAGNVDHGAFWGLGHVVRNCSAVTGACMLLRPSVYWEVGGHDERLRIAWNDVDLCLRVRQAGYDVVYTPYAELFHVEGGTRGIHAHVEDDDFFEARWVTHKCLDPYYNANLERLHPFRIRA